MFLEWESNSLKLQIISGKFQNSRKFQNNAINDIKQISLSHVIRSVSYLFTKFHHVWNNIVQSQSHVTLYSTCFPNNEITTCFLTICFYKLWQVLNYDIMNLKVLLLIVP